MKLWLYIYTGFWTHLVLVGHESILNECLALRVRELRDVDMYTGGIECLQVSNLK